MKSPLCLRNAFLPLALVASASTPLSAQTWHVVDLGRAYSWTFTGVNNSNMVAYSPGVPLYRPARWTPTGGAVDMGGDDYQYVFAINRHGQVVGTGLKEGSFRPFAAFWDSDDTLTIIGALDSAKESRALGINDSGAVVGASGTAFPKENRGFIWTEAAGMQALPNLGDDRGTGRDINNLGHVAGSSTKTASSDYEHAYWWSGETDDPPVDLLPSESGSTTSALNDTDVVVGEYGLSFITPFRWTPAGGSETLTHPGVQGWTSDINNSGVTVGHYQIAETVNNRACYWRAGETAAVNLNSHLPSGSGWVLEYALSINDAGVIVGGGTLNGDDHAFLIAPFPIVMPDLLVDWNASETCNVYWPHTDGIVLFQTSDLGSWAVSAHTPEVVDGTASVTLGGDAVPVFFKLTTGATPPPDEPH